MRERERERESAIGAKGKHGYLFAFGHHTTLLGRRGDPHPVRLSVGQSVGRSTILGIPSGDQNTCWPGMARHGIDHDARRPPDFDPRCCLILDRSFVGIVRFVDLLRRFGEENSFCE